MRPERVGCQGGFSVSGIGFTVRIILSCQPKPHMTLSAESRFGPYQNLSALGVGDLGKTFVSESRHSDK
jgi:hypothetical protein